MEVTAATTADDYQALGVTPTPRSRETRIRAVDDTGCQNCLIGLSALKSLGITHKDLIPVKLKMTAANDKSIRVSRKTCWTPGTGTTVHSVLLPEEDRHLTTFITPWGRYRYRTAPQGYAASDDEYTRRYDEIVSHIPRKIKGIDDVLLWLLQKHSALCLP